MKIEVNAPQISEMMYGLPFAHITGLDIDVEFLPTV
jgi:hypothetical protein